MRYSSRYIALLATPAAIVLPAGAVRAEQYLDVEQAQRALFPAATRFEPVPLALSDEQRRAVAKSSPTRTRIPTDRVWRAFAAERPLGHFIVDEVYGKHEFITYAAAIDPAGAALGIEIMDYRETHGGQVREPSWREQFVGKRSSDPFKLGDDIANISGATMSCKHVADGMKRLLTLHDVALRGQ